MSSSQLDPYAAVLADLEAKRAQIDAAIATIKAIQGDGALGSIVAADLKKVEPKKDTEIKADTFFSLSIPDAAKKYLGMIGCPATTPEITDALTRGNQSASKGANYATVVGTALNRVWKTNSGISKVSRGTWGLTEWYSKKDQ